MINDQQKTEILQTLELAKLHVDTGNVYQINWPVTYIKDINLLLESIETLEETVDGLQRGAAVDWGKP